MTDRDHFAAPQPYSQDDGKRGDSDMPGGQASAEDILLLRVVELEKQVERMRLTRPEWNALHQAAYGHAMAHDDWSQARLRAYLRKTADEYGWKPPAVARVGQ